MGDYRRKLAENSLFREEYDAIVQINQSEGGIEKFFERARKSRNVIERLIIPAIPSLAGEDQSLLAGTFKKHLENLKNIPLLQYNINVYQSFLERGKELLDLLGEHERTMELSAEFKLQIKIFENIMVVVAERVKDGLERLENERTGLKETKEELNYKFESLEIFLEEQKKLQLEEESKNINTKIEIERFRLSDFENKIKYANAANSWLGFKEQRKRHLELKEKLQILNVEEGELQKEYQDYIFTLSQLITGELERLKASIDKLEVHEKETLSERKSAKDQITAKRNQRESISNELAVKNSEQQRAEADSKRYSARFNSRDLTLLMNPQDTLNGFENKLKEIEKERLRLEEQRNTLLIQEEDSKIKINRLSQEKRALEERCSSKNLKMQEYERKLSLLKDEAEAMGIKDDLYYGTVVAKLAALEEKAAFDLASVQVSHNAIENKKLLLNGLDYFVADKDILMVYKYLEDNGVACMPGSLWLKKQPESKRERLLKNNPLLSCAIIVDASMLDKIKKHSEAISKLVENYPVAIILGNDSGLSCSDVYETEAGELKEKKEVYLDVLKGSEIYFLSSVNKGLLISEKELEAFISSLDKRLEKSAEQITTLRADQLKILGLKERVTTFLQEYSQAWKNQLVEEIKQLTAEIDFLGKESDRLNREQQEMKKARSETEINLSGLESSFADTKLDIAEIMEYIKAKNSIKENSEAIRSLVSKLKGFENEICMLENKVEEMNNEIKETEKKKDELFREENKLKRSYQDIQNELTVEKASRDILCSMEELEAKVNAIRQRRSIGERDEIVRTIQDVESLMEKYRKSVKTSGYDEIDFKDIFEIIPESEMLILENSEADTKKALKELEGELRETEKKIDSLEGRIKALSDIVRKKFVRNKYEFNIGESIELEYYEDQIKELETKLRKLNTKIDDGLNRTNEVNKQLSSIQQFIEDNKVEVPKDLQADMLQLKGFEESIGLWDMMKMKAGEVSVLFKRYKDGYKEIESRVENSRIKVEKHFDSLYLSDEWKDNATVKRILSGIMKENLYDIQYMNELFGRLFESVRRMQEAETLQLEECKRNKSELVERCLQRSQAVYEELKLVDSFSKIKIGGQSLKVIKLEMPKLEEEQGRAMMMLYLEKCIEEISKLKEERTYDPAKIDGIIIEYMSAQRLLDAVISLNDISISVYKPEHNMELSQYIPWEVVIQWSGGEKLAGFFAMFISIVSYLRFKKTGYQGSKKVIWIDNPFGQANAGHLLEYIFELAKATNTQMICLTGLQETNIYAQFDVVYSLVHRMLSSMSIIQSKQVKAGKSIEVAYYNLKGDQMSLF